MTLQTDTSLRNIAFLCTYFTSSLSDWERHKSGSPLDHYLGADRFSFHTEEEEAPFIHVDLPAETSVSLVRIVLRDQYSEKILPLEITARTANGKWAEVGKITEKEPYIHDIEINQPINALRVAKCLFGYLYLSSINIYVEENSFNTLVSSLSEQPPFILAHAPFYGLGGGLAVCASATGAVGRGRVKKLLVDQPLSDLLAYPAAFEHTPANVAVIRENLSKAVAGAIFDDEVRYKSKQSISLWIEDGRFDHQERPVVLVTRDNVSHYTAKNETEVSASQRLYQRLIPSQKVAKVVNRILDSHGLSEDVFARSLGVHIRHGNGERYYSTRSKKWGVKPPPLSRIISAIKEATEKSGIDTLVVCSDTKASAQQLSEKFPELKIIFISDQIQEIGAGCNHLPFVFDDTIARRDVRREDDDTVSFAEILVLSKCARLCGGSSYFYNAVIGFSNVPEDQIFYIDNKDRYATVSSDATPLLETEESIAQQIAAALREKSYFLDGLFVEFRRDDQSDTHGKGNVSVTLSYFDTAIATAGAADLCAMILGGEFEDKLIELRMYAA